MKISTKKSQGAKEGKNGTTPGRKAKARKNAPRNIGKNRVTGRRILAGVKLAGKLGGTLLVAASILSVGICAYNSENFHLNAIAIQGCNEAVPAKLEKVIRDNFAGNILKMDMDLLQNRLEQEKWIRNVEIRRVLPSGLLIYVKERVPSVILEMNDLLMIADDEGILLDAYTPEYGKLDVPVFKGIVGKNPESYQQYQEENRVRIHHALDMLSEIESGSPTYTQKISEVDISDRNNLKIMLVDSTAEIHLGKEDYLNRFRALLESDEYQKFKNQNIPITEINLRIDGQIIFSGIRNVSGSPNN